MSYEKTEWKTGDIVTAEKLNNIENGINDLSNGFDGIIKVTIEDVEAVATPVEGEDYKTFHWLDAFEHAVHRIYQNRLNLVSTSGMCLTTEPVCDPVLEYSIKGADGETQQTHTSMNFFFVSFYYMGENILASIGIGQITDISSRYSFVNFSRGETVSPYQPGEGSNGIKYKQIWTQVSGSES